MQYVFVITNIQYSRITIGMYSTWMFKEIEARMTKQIFPRPPPSKFVCLNNEHHSLYSILNYFLYPPSNCQNESSLHIMMSHHVLYNPVRLARSIDAVLLMFRLPQLKTSFNEFASKSSHSYRRILVIK